MAHGVLVPQLGIELVAPALAVGVLTMGPPGKYSPPDILQERSGTLGQHKVKPWKMH